MFIVLAFRNVFRNRMRSLITLLVISSGCVSMILAAGFVEDTLRQVRENYIRDFLGHLRVYHQGYLEQGLLHPFDYLISDTAALEKQVSGVEHVRKATARLTLAGLVSNGDTTLSFIGQAVDPEKDQALRNTSQVTQGSFLESNPTSSYDILVGKGLAKALQAKPGDALVLVGNTARGAINALDVQVKGIFGTSDKGFDDHAIRLPIQVAQKLLRTQGVESLMIYLDATREVDAVKMQLEALFARDHLPYEVRAWYQLEEADYVFKLTAVYRSVFKVIKIIILSVVFLGIVNTMNMIVLERVGEIGTLMALGMKSRGVAGLFMLEGFILGLLGSTLGCAAGGVLSILISKVGITMPTPPSTTITWVAHIALSPQIFIPAFTMGVLTSLLSSVLPALKAARMEIGESLRHNL